MRQVIPLDWVVGPASSAGQVPERFVSADVPGAVQLDWAWAEGWPDYWFGDNFRQYEWMEDKFWRYRCELPAVGRNAGQSLYFVCMGVDYQCAVYLDGRMVHAQTGMFTPFEVEISPNPDGNSLLEVLVYPAPKRHPGPVDRSQASASVKPAVSYGWDWHPRLIPLGIWEDTCLELRPSAHLRDAELGYSLSGDLSRTDLQYCIEVSDTAIGKAASWKLTGPDGGTVDGGTVKIYSVHQEWTGRLADPKLWWPHDHGEQPLYTFEVELVEADGTILDRKSHRLGFRRVRLVPGENGWDHPTSFPKSRPHVPVQVEINGRRIFIRGSNWVNPEVFPGIISAETYTPLLELAREANLNMLRCWGGAPVQKESFFAQCDELGLLVWQEFPLACNCYPDDEAYLQVLDQESRSIIKRVRRHACLALWCGGNELYNRWSRMTDHALAIRLLNRNCYDLDPQTCFLPTAPVYGMAHGDYRFKDDEGREIFEIFSSVRHTAYSEFGCPGPSPVDYLKTFIPGEDLWPIRWGTAWESHHALGAWMHDNWLPLETIRHYFGEPVSLEELVDFGTRLQCAGLQFVFEEARRQKPDCSMALNWCFNEPWPSAANNSIINWPAKPKPAFDAVAAACRPVLASARIPRFSWNPDDTFKAELYMLNDSPDPLPAGTQRAVLVCGQNATEVLSWDFPASLPGRNVEGPELRFRLPANLTSDTLELHLEVASHPEWNSCYRLHMKAGAPVNAGLQSGSRSLNL